METTSATARYLYAVCRGLDPLVVADLRGLNGEPVALVGHQDLAAVVSDVPLEDFDEDALRRNLEDLSWLESVVRVHDDVINAVAAHAPTAPLRLATICFDDDAVRARLREWYVALMQALDRVEGCAEWSVKVLAPPQTVEPVGSAGQPVAASGAEYLRRKKAAAQERVAGDEVALEAAEHVHDYLVQLATASRRLAAQDPRLSGHQGTMVLNAAYLVPDENTEAFAARIEQLRSARPDVVVDGRGPWPPYSFALLEQR